VICLYTGKKSDDPKSDSYVPTIFARTGAKTSGRTTATSVHAGKLSPSKRLAAVLRARRRRHIYLKRSALLQSRSGRIRTLKVQTPAVDFHGYASADTGATLFSDKLHACEQILPGITDIVAQCDKNEKKNNYATTGSCVEFGKHQRK